MSKRNRALYFLTYPTIFVGMVLGLFFSGANVVFLSYYEKFTFIFLVCTYVILFGCVAFFGIKVNITICWIIADFYLILSGIMSITEGEFAFYIAAGFIMFPFIFFAPMQLLKNPIIRMTSRIVARPKFNYRNCFIGSVIISLICFLVCVFIYRESLIICALIIPTAMQYLLCAWAAIKVNIKHKLDNTEVEDDNDESETDEGIDIGETID